MRLFSKTALVGVAALALSACDSSDDVNFGTSLSQASIQAVHAVADAPAVNVINRGGVLASGLGFKQATGFVPVNAGSASLSIDAILPAGTLNVVPPTSLVLAKDSTYTVIAIGSAATSITPVVLENPDLPVGAGNVRVQVLHGAANVGPVDIYVTGPADEIVPGTAIAGGSTAFGAASGQLEITAGDYRIRVTLPGEINPVFDSGTVTLPAGADLVVVAVDNTVAGSALMDASPVTLLVADGEGQFEIFDEATPAEVRVVHAVPDANEVDVFVNDPMAMDAPAIEDLDYQGVIPAADDYLAVDAGTINVLVTGANNPGFIAIPASDIELAAGTQYTVYASGSIAGGIAPYITVDDGRPILTEAKTRIIHLAPSAGLVDIYVTAPMTDITAIEPTLEDVDFGADTGYLSLAEGSYEVTVTLADTKTVAIGPAAIDLDAGSVYTAVARDPDADIGNDSFGLILLDDF